MWVGKEYYTPAQFLGEAHRLGISKRIPSKVEGLQPGDVVYFVHNEVLEIKDKSGEVIRKKRGIFACARLTEYQKVLSEEEALKPEVIKNLEDQGIVPVLERGPMDGQVELGSCCEGGA